jgi:hypothetical protein
MKPSCKVLSDLLFTVNSIGFSVLPRLLTDFSFLGKKVREVEQGGRLQIPQQTGQACEQTTTKLKKFIVLGHFKW